LLRSPTFTLVQEHHRQQDVATLYHIDLYRVESERDLGSLGLEEIMDDDNALVLIEWPERAPNCVPKSAIHVKISITSDTKRLLTLSTQDAQTWQVLLAFRKSAFGV
jgi:tRNA threonylcarbamoyladenosine biosynthesis protein TsaE